MVREFQRVIGDEARRQCAAELAAAVPDYVVACVGGGSNALGTFAGFVDTAARRPGVAAEGGSRAPNGALGVLHAVRPRFPQQGHRRLTGAPSFPAARAAPRVDRARAP